MNKQVLVLDSSQISTYLECPTKHNLQYVESITWADEAAVREDMAAGTYGHKLLELYYTALACGQSLETAVCRANKFHLEDDFPLSQARRDLVADRFKIYWMTYQHQDIIPSLGVPIYRVDSLPEINQPYEFSGKINPMESIGMVEVWEPKPLVEQGFSYEVLNDRNYLFVLEGRIDMIGSLNGQLVWMDHKFQGRRHDLYKKSIQFRNYSLACNLTLGVINYIRLHKEITKDTLVRDIVSFNPRERELWREELIELYKHIASESEAPRRKNWGACAGKFGYPCEYTKICEESDTNISNAIKETYYKKKEVWKPW